MQGLSSHQAAESRARHGANVITPPKKEPVWKLFADKFRDPIIQVLLVAAALSLGIAFFDGDYIETIGICAAILLATGVAFWFEYDAMKRFEVLNKVSDDMMVKVIRDGHIEEIPRRDVVVGDTVIIESGEEIPADGRLVEAVSLSVNESTLTGELLTAKSTDPANFVPDATYPTDTVLRGTTVSEGHGMFTVGAVGDSTEQGKVARTSTAPKTRKTPLEKQLSKLSSIIGRYGLAISGAVLAILVVKGFLTGSLSGGWLEVSKELLSYFMVAVALMVMAIPEGLPMSITLSLAMNMRRMIRTNNLVRKMHACETMGAVTVICTDKTGTLTENRMQVDEIIEYDCGGDGVFEESLAVNSTAHLGEDGKVMGNPTEGALLLWLKENGRSYLALREKADTIDQMTFSTERKYMATLVRSGATGRKTLYIKGAPEIVGAMCYAGGLPQDISDRLRDFQNRAMRTLGFARVETDCNDCVAAIASCKPVFMAIAAISDPVREEVPGAVRKCTDAGIKIKMVTGDNAHTALEIARRIGLWDDSVDTEENRITGPEFAAMSDEELLKRVAGLKIMSRARPLDKQRLVRLLQRKGEIVAVTGDGTNDAPALNAANVGLSMGSGTSVAIQASDITLLDDSFATIATAVMWGRSLYKNIQRFILFQLTVNFTALAVVFIGTVFGQGAPLTVTQILWVNIIMDTFAAMALASLPPNPAVMREKPRGRRDFIISRPMIRNICWTGALFVATLLGMLWYGRDFEGAELASFMSMFFTVFVFLHFWNLFNARLFGVKDHSQTKLGDAKGFLGILLIIAAGQFIITTFGGEVFRTVPLSWQQWAWSAGATALVVAYGYMYRKIAR